MVRRLAMGASCEVLPPVESAGMPKETLMAAAAACGAYMHTHIHETDTSRGANDSWPWGWRRQGPKRFLESRDHCNCSQATEAPCPPSVGDMAQVWGSLTQQRQRRAS